ncbi:MAG: TldD/PmbA family protein [Candidatus Micrarchaeota archaeon]
MDYCRLLSGYDYAELRLGRGHESQISIKDGEVKNVSGSAEGVSVRVLINGSWGFASSSRLAGIPGLIKKAERLAKLESGRIRVGEVREAKKTIREDAVPADPEEQVKTLLEAANAMEHAEVISRMVSCSDGMVEREFFDSHGSHIIQRTASTYLSCSCVARSGDLIQRGSHRGWSKSGFMDMDIMPIAKEARDKALRLLKAGPPPKGRFTVVLDPEMTGVFSHEAVGHACEADAVVDKESILTDRMGKKIGDERVTIIDDPAADDFGRYAFDDEGVEGKPVKLVDKGILSGYLNSRETAAALGMEPNGHARSDGYDSVPVVRMGNTYFQRGSSSVDDVFDVKQGIYLKGMKGGSVDIFSGGFMFKAEEAYEIVKGEKGKIMRDVTITGNILETLLNVESVGNDFGTSPGICGKAGQQVPVSDGGPHIRVKNVAIG